MAQTPRCPSPSTTTWTTPSALCRHQEGQRVDAHTYSHLYGIPTTGLRFFTRAILQRQPIDGFNEGKMRRDFNYIDDIVEGVMRVLDNVACPNLSWSGGSPDPPPVPPYRLSTSEITARWS